MACQVFRNPSTKEIVKVMAPNGKPSKLYEDILKRPELKGNKEAALDIWLHTYTSNFKDKHGDWENKIDIVDPGVDKYFKAKNIFASINSIETNLKTRGLTGAGLGSNKKIDEVLLKAGLDAELRKQFLDLLAAHPKLKTLKLHEVLSSYVASLVKDSDRAYHVAIESPLDKELEQTLIKYFERFKIRRQELDSLKEKFGVDSVGVFDVLAKTVYYAKDRNLLTLPEEYGHVFVELLGSIASKAADNQLFSYLSNNIEKWDGYQRVYESYKDKYITSTGTIDIYRIKKEAIGQAIGLALVGNFKVSKGDKDFWAKIQEAIEYLVKLLKDVDMKTLNTVVDGIAKDILSGNYDKLDRLRKNTSNYNLLGYSETIKMQNKKDGGKAVSFMQYFSKMGNIITGSLAYRAQGSTYRPEIDALHDIDMIVPGNIHKVDTSKYKDNMRLDVNEVAKNDYFSTIKKQYPDMEFLYSFVNKKANGYYVTVNAIWSEDQSLKDRFKSLTGSFNKRLENFTEEELGKMYLFDFFLRPENEDQYVVYKDEQYGLNLAHFSYAFYEKLNSMGRPKDAFDYQMWDFFDEKSVIPPDFNDRMVYYQLKAEEKNNPKTPNWVDKSNSSDITLDQNGEPLVEYVLPDNSYNLSRTAEQFVYQQSALQKAFMFVSGLTLMTRNRAENIVNNIKKENKYSALKGTVRGVNDGSRISYVVEIEEKPLKEVLQQRSVNSLEIQKTLVNQVINRLAAKFPKLQVKWITADQLNPKEHAVDVSNVNAYVKDGVIYLVEGRVTESIAIEEMLHPFVESLFQDNKALFTGLFNKGKEANPRLWAKIQNAYLDSRGFTEADRKKEMVTRILQQVLQDKMGDSSEKSWQELKMLLQRFFNWLSELLSEAFDIRTNGDIRVEAYNLPTKITYEELANIINTKNVILSTAVAESKAYDLDAEPDSQEVNSAKDIKLARVEEQQNVVRKTIADLKKIKGTDAKIATLEKILLNLDAYRQSIQNDEFSVSVTNLTGGGKIENQELYEDFKHFGTFIHYILENVQKAGIESGKKVTTILTREMFDMLADSYPDSFNIENMSRDEMYSMSQEMISYLQIYVTKGYTLLPEISAFGKDRNNRNIVGRIDVLGIAPSGKVEILDLKTKKIYTNYSLGIALNTQYPVLSTTLTDPDFSKNRRSSYDNWDTQLSVYERIYGQSGIPVDSKTVLALIYRGDSIDVTDINASQKLQFRYSGYEFMVYTSDQRQQGSEHDKLNFANVQSVVKKVIPIKGEIVEEAKPAKESFIFNMKDEDYTRLLNNLESVAEEEIRKIQKSLSELDEKNPNDRKLVDYYKARRESIRKIQDTFRQDSAKSEQWGPAYKLTAILKYLSDNTEGMKQTAQDIANIPSQVERARKLDDLKNKAVAFNYFLTDIRELLINLNDQRNEPAIKLLDSIQGNIDYTMGVFNEIGFNYLVDVLKNSLTPEIQERISKERIENIDPLIKHLKEKVQKLKDKQAQGGSGNTVTYSVWQGLTNIARSALKVPIDTKNEIDAIEIRIKTLELRREGIKLDDASVRQYIQSILDKNSLYYIGSDSTALTDFVAAASSSDIGIAGFANHLKFIEVRAKQLYLNFMERNKFQEMYDKFRKGKTDLSAINAPISEIREVVEYNSEGEPVIKRYRSFKDPVTEAYKNVFKKYWNDLRKINRQIRATGDINEKKALGKTKGALIQQHKAWRLEHSQMPLVDEIYELDKFLPEDFKLKRDELYEEREAILAQVGMNEEEKLSEEDLEELAEIEIALKKLKQEAINQNASYQEYMEKMEKYYSYEPNIFFFERIKNSKQIEYADDPIMMKKWMEMNTYRTPNEKYFQELNSLYEELFNLLPQDTMMQELRQKQRDILRAYKRNGFVDTRFLSKEDIKIYQEIEDQLEELRKESGSIMTGLSVEDKERVGEIFTELNALSSTYLNPYYDRDYRSRVESLEQKLFLYNEAKRKAEEATGADKVQLTRERDQALDNYYVEEKDFESWYNLNHYNEYESKLMGNPLNPVPRSFNFLKLPADPSMMDVKPSFKYSIRKLKEEAKNVNYQETVDGFPMPKGMKIVNDVVTIEKTSQWVSPDYEALTKQADNFEFYKQFVGQYLKMQVQTYGRNLGYFFPGFEETSGEIYKQKGFKEGFKTNFEIFKQKNFTASSIFDYSINDMATGNENMVRMKFNRPIDLNEAEGTVDGIGAVIRWYEEAFINQAVGEAQPLVSATLSYLNNLYKQLDQSNIPDKENRKTSLKRVIDSYTFEYQKIIKGESKLNEGNMGKLGDTLLKAIGFTRLGFDMANQVGNYFSGNIQIFLGGHKTGQYNNTNLLKAKSQFYGRDGLMASLLRDSNKFSGFTFMTKMYLYFNPSQMDLKNSFDKTRSTGQRLAQGALDLQAGFWIQDKGEVEISSTIWLAIMDNRTAKLVAERDASGKVTKYQTNPDGTEKRIPVFEAYTQNQYGEVVIRDDVDWTKDDERNLMGAIFSEIRRTQGNYASADKSRAERGILGRFLVFYRKYLVPFVLNRFGSSRDNMEAGEVAMGYYNALIRGLMYYKWKLFAGMIGKDDTVSPYYAKKAFYAVREMVLASLLYILGTFLNSVVKSLDDDEEDQVAKNIAYQLLAIYIKVERETRSMVPVPIVGSLDEYINQFTDFTNFGRDITRVVKLTEHGIALGAAQMFDSELVDKAAYYQRRTGIFDKGDAKILKDIYDVTGFMNFYELYNPEVRVEDSFKRR